MSGRWDFGLVQPKPRRNVVALHLPLQSNFHRFNSVLGLGRITNIGAIKLAIIPFSFWEY
jgi:hypothetical protein